MTHTLDSDYWQERARAVLPSATDEQVADAAVLLAECYSTDEVRYQVEGSDTALWQYGPAIPTPSQAGEDPRDLKPRTIGAPYLTGLRVADPRALDPRVGGGVVDLPQAPDAWSAVKSTIGRNRMNGTDEVKVRGVARVQGGTIGTGACVSDGLMSQMLEDLPRNSIGAAGWQVSRLTDVLYADLPGRADGDTSTAGEHVPAGVDLGQCRGVVHSDGGENGLTWPTVRRLPRLVLRKSERGYVKQIAVRTRADGTQAPVFDTCQHEGRGRWIATMRPIRTAYGQHVRTLTGETVRQCVDYVPGERDATPRLFTGHRVMLRGKVAHTSTRRADRTLDLGTVTIDTPAAMQIVADAMNRGERIAVRYNGLAVTVTRSAAASGVFSATVTGRGKVGGIRTTANLTRRLSELVA